MSHVHSLLYSSCVQDEHDIFEWLWLVPTFDHNYYYVYTQCILLVEEWISSQTLPLLLEPHWPTLAQLASGGG